MSEHFVVDKDAIQCRRESLVRWMAGKQGSIRDLAKSLGVHEGLLYEDWKCRDRWLGAFFRLQDVKVLVLDEVAGWHSYIEENLSMARRYDMDGAKSAANTAMKNVREAKMVLADLLQSMGCLPKVAIQYEVDNKVQMTEVKCNESDNSVLNKAAEILADAERKGQSRTIH